MSPAYLRLHPVLIVAAHPDDETIGLGGQFGALKDPYILHITDGAPSSMPSRGAIATRRRRELESAMRLTGVELHRCLEFGAPDQGSSFQLGALARRLSALLSDIQPQVVITHPYEGGHPDHDACSFIVQVAVGMARSLGRQPPLRVEFASYHNGCPQCEHPRMQVGRFLPGPEVSTIRLSPAERDRKRRMFECFQTQQEMLRQFPIREERLRLAPLYDFSVPPHPGQLYYDDKNWGVTAAEWRQLAGAAELDLGLRAT